MRSNPQRGLTLVELMVAVAIAGIAMAAAFSLGYSMMDGYREHRRAVDVERSARASMQLIADAARNASVGVQSGDLQDLVSCTETGPLHLENASDGPDRLQVIHALGGVITEITTNPFANGSDKVYVSEVSGFRAGDYVIVADVDDSRGKIVEVDYIHDDHLHVLYDGSCWVDGTTFGRGSLVLRGQVSGFAIDDSLAAPVLMQSPDGLQADMSGEQPVALGIEDLQIAVGVDHDDDGMIDEWHHSAPGDPDPPDPTSTRWRALRITVVARSLHSSTDDPVSTRPAAEDRAGAEEPDEFRRRVLSTVVELRNLEGSP